MTVFTDIAGNNTYRGSADYDQVDYDAPLSEYSIFTNADGSVTVSHPTLGTDKLFDIDGIWSIADSAWYSIADAIALTPNATPSTPAPTAPGLNTDGFKIDEYGVLNGTSADDLLTDTGHALSGGLGDDTLVGRADAYSQADYAGASKDYTFTQNADGTITVTNAEFGTDTLKDIDGIWFGGEAAWYAIEDLVANVAPAPAPTPIPVPVPTPEPAPTTPDLNTDGFKIDEYGVLNGTSADDLLTDTGHALSGGLGDDTLVGRADAYSQADYAGASKDYTFTQNADGTITVTNAEFGTDTLKDIDGIWFGGEAAWYAIEDLVEGPTSVDPAPADPAPVDPAPADPAPADPAPADPAPADPAPAPAPAPAPGADTGTVIDGVITGSNDVDDVLNGTGGDDTFFAGRGTDVIQGGAGNDTLVVDGDIIEWTFSANADGSVTMTHPTWGENTLVGIEQITSLRAGETFSIDDAIASTAGLPRFRLDADNVINGTNLDDVLEGGAGIQGFYGGTGDDVYLGSDDFVQVNYDGARSEFNISQNGDGSITVDHPIWGTDTLNNIDALIFTGVEPGVGGAQTAPFEFVSTDDLFG